MNTKTISVEMLEKQIRWENHQVEEGVAKYQKAMVEKSMNGTTGGQRLISNALPRTIAAINEAYREVDDLMFNNTHGGGVDNWVYMIGLVSAEQTAVIALNKAFAFCLRGFLGYRLRTITQTDLDAYTKSRAQPIGQKHRTSSAPAAEI